MDALHPKRDLPQPEQKSPALADEQKQSTPHTESHQTASSTAEGQFGHQKVKMRDVNSSLTCHLCKGYLIDATTISECLHSFCRSCIIKFLQENSYCPVCEVIINKAKPNLKLDKTLQDIVYKLVPGLFLSEMMKRRGFYAGNPTEAGRVSPEQRGEDTERTIFSPQDRISLSLEYIGDAATTGLILKDLKHEEASDNGQTESLLKRYLQCPAMCRVDVIKKFIRNKYNVNTDLFQIDILYKRVPLPLPDHYTLVDVAYIYTWKRNEPMRFYFRIIDKGNDELPDLTKVFTPVDDGPIMPLPLTSSTPTRPIKVSKERNRKIKKASVAKKLPVARPTKKEKKDESICDNKRTEVSGRVVKKSPSETTEDVKSEVDDTCDKDAGARKDENADASPPDAGRVKKETDHCDNGKVYTNITLNRANNVEIVTKIQKLSDKDGQQIEVNVIDQNARQKTIDSATNDEDSGIKTEIKTEALDIATEMTVKVKPPPESSKNELATSENENVKPKREPSVSIEQKPFTEACSSATNVSKEDEELEKAKFEFLKSIELTSKNVVHNIARLQQQNNTLPNQNLQNQQQGASSSQKQEQPKPNVYVAKTKKPMLTAKPVSNGLKRKNSSPMKNEPKRQKGETKRTTTIILQQKPGFPPLNLAKPTEKTAMSEELINQNRNELRSLFQNCRLNIPSSLSITLKENGETSRQPVQMPPVQNFIEILKIDEKAGTQTVTLKREESVTPAAKRPSSSETHSNQVPKTASKLLGAPMRQTEQMKKKSKELAEQTTKEQQSFQKIFEESIKKVGSETGTSSGDVPMSSAAKKKISDIAQQLIKRTKIEQNAKNNVATTPGSTPTTNSLTTTPKIAIPRLNQRVVKPPKRSQKYDNSTHQTLTNLHSSSLGLNYTVSVGKQSREIMTQKSSKGIMTPPVPRNGENNSKVSPCSSSAEQARTNAALGSAFLAQPSPVSPITGEVKTGGNSIRNPKAMHSPKTSLGLPKTEQNSPINFSIQSPMKNKSPRPSSRNQSPKPSVSNQSPKPSVRNQSPKPRASASPNSLPSSSSSGASSAPSTNELLEKYNIQNLAQLTASMNYNAQNYLNSISGKQITALHQAMMLKQLEMQNRQSWYDIPQAPLLQYEKYLQSAAKNQLMGNLKDN